MSDLAVLKDWPVEEWICWAELGDRFAPGPGPLTYLPGATSPHADSTFYLAGLLRESRGLSLIDAERLVPDSPASWTLQAGFKNLPVRYMVHVVEIFAATAAELGDLRYSGIASLWGFTFHLRCDYRSGSVLSLRLRRRARSVMQAAQSLACRIERAFPPLQASRHAGASLKRVLFRLMVWNVARAHCAYPEPGD